jgi:hypothetical protein
MNVKWINKRYMLIIFHFHSTELVLERSAEEWGKGGVMKLKCVFQYNVSMARIC